MKNEINENEPLLVASVTSSAFLMDCIDGMKQYPDKYFDLAVVDPPYGMIKNTYGSGKLSKA